MRASRKSEVLLCLALFATTEIASIGEIPSRKLESLELFAGEQAITQASASFGLSAVAYDKRYDPKFQDITKPLGFRNALNKVLQLKEGGCLKNDKNPKN